MPKAPRTSSTPGTSTGNAWTLFRSAELKRFKAETGRKIEQGDFSRMLSPIWNAMDPQEKKPWFDLAREKKEEARRLATLAENEVAPSRATTVARGSSSKPGKSRSKAAAKTQSPLAVPFVDSRATSVSSDLGDMLFQGSTSTASLPIPQVWRSVQVREVFPTTTPDGSYQWQFPLASHYVSNEHQEAPTPVKQAVDTEDDDWFIDPSLRNQ